MNICEYIIIINKQSDCRTERIEYDIAKMLP